MLALLALAAFLGARPAPGPRAEPRPAPLPVARGEARTVLRDAARADAERWRADPRAIEREEEAGGRRWRLRLIEFD